VSDSARPAPIPVASFTYRVGEDRWDWSDEVFGLYGFVRGEVVPTAELLLVHSHAADRDLVVAFLSAVPTTRGEPLVCRFRIVDAGQRERTVVVFANGVLDAHGRVRVIEGVFADVTKQVREEVQEVAQVAIDGAIASRSVIDEAKGVLMGRYGLCADEAFDVLRVLSSHTNCKVRTLATQLIEVLTRQPPVDGAVVLKDLESALHPGEDCDPVGSELPSHNGFSKPSDP
jgi:AmiR/NasT family two-component response regulator